MNTAVIIGLTLVVLLAATAIWWAMSTSRRRNQATEADPPAPDPLAALTSSLNESLAGMRTEVGRSLTTVQDSLNNLAEQGGQTQERLAEVANSNTTLRETTTKLQNLLSDNKSRGRWGEKIAENVIRETGLIEGVNFHTQVSLPNKTKPDFSFKLPEEKMLHMDAKFPLDNYERYTEVQSEKERKTYLGRFISDVKVHIKDLAKRGYAEAEDGVGFTLLFIPVESVWVAILQQKDILQTAAESRVALCTPTTLYPILMMISNIMDSIKMVENGREIVKAVVAFERAWEDYGKTVTKMGNNLTALSKTFTELTNAKTNILQHTMTTVSNLRIDSSPPADVAPDDRQDPPVADDAA